MKKTGSTLFALCVPLLAVAFLTSCSMLKPSESHLSYPIGINTSEGFTDIVAAGQKLPMVYSETYTNEEDNQGTANIEISQKRKDGIEKIVDVHMPIPDKAQGEVEILITLKIDSDKMLRVKASVMDSGAVKEFGPFPVE